MNYSFNARTCAMTALIHLAGVTSAQLASAPLSFEQAVEQQHDHDHDDEGIDALLHEFDKQIQFVENRGQFDQHILAKADVHMGQILATNKGMLLKVYDPESVAARNREDMQMEQDEHDGVPTKGITTPLLGHGWMMQFENSSEKMHVETRKAFEGVNNYFLGDDPAKHALGVKTHKEIWYRDVYKEVDVRYYPAEDGSLEYDIICMPGSNPKEIAINFKGIERIRLDEKGQLILPTSLGELSFPAPYVYQSVRGTEHEVSSSYVIRNGRLSFELGNYDPEKPLVIDPIALRWATWINTNTGGEANHGHCIWVDPSDGAIYVAARPLAATDNITVGAFDITYNGGVDLLIGKYFEPTTVGGSGTRVWQTYIGGSNHDNPYAMEQGEDGHLYIAGNTQSTNYPMLGGTAFSGASVDQRTQAGQNAFITKINTDGNSIKSAVIGGSAADVPYDLRLHGITTVLVSGNTNSDNLATTNPGSGATTSSGTDALVMSLNQDLSTVNWIDNFGGTGDERANIMLCSTAGDIYVGGWTESSNFPTVIARQGTMGGDRDGFLQRRTSTGSVVWSSYFNSMNNDETSILCMEFNTTETTLCVGGYSNGLDNSNTSAGSYDTSFNGGTGTGDFFAACMNVDQTFVAGTYVGGTGNEVNMMGLNLDENNDVYIFGYTSSTNFPTTTLPNTALEGNDGDQDKVFLKLTADLATLEYSTYFGGGEDETDPVGQRGIKFSNCRIYTIVTSESNDIPLTQGALNTSKGSADGSGDYEPGLVVWANPPDLLGNTISGNQTICSGAVPGDITGSIPQYVLPTITRNGSTSPHPSLGSATTYQWQTSTDGINWINVGGATGQNLAGADVGALTENTFIRRIIGGDACILDGAADQIVTVEVISVSATITDVSCNGGDDGSITASSNGTGPFNYAWNHGPTSATISGLTAGSYTVTVTDNNNCMASNTFVVDEPMPLMASQSVQDATCSDANGVASVTPSGGTSPYMYLWSTSATSPGISGVMGGAYSVTITDMKGCTLLVNVNIGSTGLPNVDAGTAGLINCNTGPSIMLNGSSTTPSVTYNWVASGGGNITGPANTPTPTVNAAGVYTLTVTDQQSNCSISDATQVSVDTISPNASASVSDTLDCLTPTVMLDGNSTTIGATYAWMGPGGFTSAMEDPNVSDSGPYDLTVTGPNGCPATTSITVEEQYLSDTTQVTASTCDSQQVGITESLLVGQDGCDSLIVTTTTLDPSDITQLTATSCDPQQVGVTQVLLTNQYGCDSLIVTTTTLNPSDTTYLSATTCNPQHVGVAQDLLASQYGCDSLIITTTTLDPSDTTQLTATSCDPQQVGVTQVLLTNQYGCDSLVVTTTTLDPSDTTQLTATSCDPQQVGVTQVLLTNQYGCDSLVVTTTTLDPSDTTQLTATSCDPQQVGVTQVLLTNQYGCDSLVVTTTTLDPSDTTQLTATSCDPQQVGVTQVLLTNQYGCDSLVVTTTTLDPSDTTQLTATSCDPQQVGVTQVLLTNQYGCDSLVVTTTTLDPSDTTQLTATSCDPQQVGVTQVLLTNQYGCDSLVVTTTTLDPSDTTQLTATSCDPQQVGVTQVLLTNQYGCDSLVVTTTTLNPSDTTQLTATSCDPQQVGVTQVLLTNQYGCDSLVVTTTTLDPSDTTQLTATSCDPQQVGVTQVLLTNQYGCDSLVVTTTTLNPSDTTQLTATSCDPQQVGVTQVLLTNQYGCDSLVVTTTTLDPSDTTQLTATSCDPQQVGVTQVLLTNQYGCDSLVVTTTTLDPSDTTQLTATSCDPQQVGVTQVLLTNQYGCDSLVVTTTTLDPSDTTQLTATSCDPQQVGVTQVLLTNQYGCDSLVVTTTTLDPSDTTQLTATSCDPQQVGVTQVLLTNQYGCDSLVVTTTTQLPLPNAGADNNTGVCDGEIVDLNTLVSPLGGTFSDPSASGGLSGTTFNTTGLSTTGVIHLDYVVASVNSCPNDTARISIYIELNPVATATGGVITCTNQTVMLDGSTSIPGASFSWTGPGVFVSSLEDPVVTIAGTYYLTLTTQSGCTGMDSAVVTVDMLAPNIMVNNGVIDCFSDSIQLNGGSSTAGVTYSWTGPDGFMSTDHFPWVTLAGNYILTVTAPNGCTASATAVITIQTSGSQCPLIWSCAPDTTVDCNSSLDVATLGEPDWQKDPCCHYQVLYGSYSDSYSGYCPRILIRTWIAFDINGNSQSCEQTITIIDNDGPVLTGVPSDTIVSYTSVPAPPYVSAWDNCSQPPPSGVYYNQQQIPTNDPNVYTLIRTWDATDACGNPTIGTQTIQVVDQISTLQLQARVILEGPYVSGSMGANFAGSGMFPAGDPYGMGFTAAPAVLNATGTSAPVDWVKVELRDAVDPTIVIATTAGIVQCSGIIVDPNGIDMIGFTGVPAANYYVVVDHYNHLGVMTAFALDLTTTPMIDLTSTTTPVFTNGDAAMKEIGNKMVLWMGDTNGDNVIKYTGSNNDRDPILVRIGGAIPTNVVNGLYTEDSGLDGQVKYTGTNNDRDPILINIGGAVPTQVRQAQLP